MIARVLEAVERRAPGLRTHLVGFVSGSGAGLVVDLGLFAVLTLVGVEPLVANLLSIAAGITTAYVLVTRFAFRVTPSWRTYVAFIVWYAASAGVVSGVVQLASGGEPLRALAVKALSVPFTFVTNYVFGRWLFGGGAERLAVAIDPRRGRRTTSQVAEQLAGTSRRRIAQASVGTVLFVVLVLPMNVAVSFVTPTDRRGALLEHLLEGLFAIALFGFLGLVLRLVAAARLGSLRHRIWLVTSGGYLVVNLVVLALVWPGYWVWDEFYVLKAAKAFSTSAWQGYLTNVFYTFGLMVGPAPVFIVIVQLALIALIFGYVVGVVATRLRRPALALLLAIPALSPVVLLNNQYPLRLTLYGALLLLLLARLFVMRAEQRRGPRPFAFLGGTLLIAILAFWRSEGVYLVLLLPVVFVVSGLHRARGGAMPRALAAAIAGVALVGSVGLVTSATTDPTYQTTAMINPLSTMLQSDLTGPHVESDLRALDRGMDLATVRANPQYQETPAFWKGAVRPGVVTALPGMRNAFVDLVVHNPLPFLQNRVNAFLAANSMEPTWFPQVQYLGVYGRNPGVAVETATFETTNFLARPLDEGLKHDTERAFLLWGSDPNRMPPGSSVVWNVLAAAAGVLVLLFVALLRRRWMWALSAAVVLANLGLVFLTEPAAYFMYYYPAYLVGSSLLAAGAALALDHRLAIRGSRSSRKSEQPRSAELVSPRPSVLLAIPAYNCAPQIGRVLSGIGEELLGRIDKVVVIDNRSTDDTAAAAERAGGALGERFQVWRNIENFGLGGSHKVAFEQARAEGYDYVAILHGDAQADAPELARLLDRAGRQPELGAVLGARFVRGSRRIGYSRVRTVGNIGINAIFSLVTGRQTVDLGSGLNLFRLSDLEDRRYLQFDDGITFNIDLLLDLFSRRARIGYEPITWREEDQVSNARNLAVGRAALMKLVRWRFNHATKIRPRAYGFEVVA